MTWDTVEKTDYTLRSRVVRPGKGGKTAASACKLNPIAIVFLADEI
jgi:hypothetical protein